MEVLSPQRREELLGIPRICFEQNMGRHKGIAWTKVAAKLEANPAKLRSLDAMEITGGEPDVVGHDKKTDEYLFFDCSPEAPSGRRSFCYDREALESLKEHPPEDSAVEMAASMGIELLTETQYLALQKLGNFDGRPPVGSRRPPTSGSMEALSSGIGVTAACSSTRTAPCYYRVRGFRGSLRV